MVGYAEKATKAFRLQQEMVQYPVKANMLYFIDDYTAIDVIVAKVVLDGSRT